MTCAIVKLWQFLFYRLDLLLKTILSCYLYTQAIIEEHLLSTIKMSVPLEH